ncbi:MULTISPECIES: hypothetical protein [Borreliella]|uniref:hypothetical protein n=1 Tax=Borreliella TaxID=64895 RepID=UPI001AEE87FC|nr:MULTISPECIES: hypothetical protein [Borreliella]
MAKFVSLVGAKIAAINDLIRALILNHYSVYLRYAKLNNLGLENKIKISFNFY